MTIPIPFSRPWLNMAGAGHAPASERVSRRAPPLAAAVAAIVGIAAERARASGELDALRDAIEAVLDTAAPRPADPREGGTDGLPPIADTDAEEEAARLRTLLARHRPR